MSHRPTPPRSAAAARRPRSTSRFTPRPLALAAHLLAAASIGWGAPAQAQATQPAQASAAQQHSYSIPAGPLNTVLTRFLAKSGLLLSGSTALAQGKTSPGVQGSHTPAAALAALLTGTGLAAAPDAQGRYTLQPAAPAPTANTGGAATLKEVTVTAGAERSGTTEGTGSYAASSTNTATKLHLTPRETPQTVTVVTSQQMQDFGMTSVDGALRATSGVFISDSGLVASTYYSRGFVMQSQYDGIPNPIGISNNSRSPQIDNAFIDRVEVQQGAAGLMMGAGTPGGTINLVRKQPTSTFQASAEAQLSSWDGRRIVGDVSGPLTESGSVRGRLVAVADNAKSFTDYVYRNRRAVYGVVEADLTSTTTLNASVQYQQDTGRDHYGAPLGADGSEPRISRSAFFGDAANHNVKDYTVTTLGLTQRLANDWQAKAVFTHHAAKVDLFRYGYLYGTLDATTGDGLMFDRQRRFVRSGDSNVVDAYASGPFHLLGRRHEAAFGFNNSSFRETLDRTGVGATDAVNIYTFDPAALGDVPEGTSYNSNSKITQFGAFGVARWSVTDALKLITGGRVSNYKNENLLTGRTSTEENGVISPYAGLIYDLNAQYSVYASYSDIFNPQTYKSADGSYVKPVVGSNYEAGIKGELLDKRLNVSAAVFRLEQTNLARRDDSVPSNPANACGGTCYIAADKVVSQGIDLGISGEIATGWNVAAGYTLTDSQYASGAKDGQRYATYMPRHSLRLSTAYKLPNTGWTLGGNLTARSKIYDSGTEWYSGSAFSIRSGGMVVVGLMTKYQINPKAELTLAVSNLFDRTYRENLYNVSYSMFGEPRKFTANLKYRF